MGFEPFHSAHPAGCLAAPDRPRDAPRTRHSHPPEPFPCPQPHCVTAAVASSPLAWCLPPSAAPPRWCAFQLPARSLPRTPVSPPALYACCPSLNLEAFLHVQVRCQPLRCHSHSPDALLGFVPLQGAPLDRGVPFCGHPAQAPTPVKQAPPSLAASQTLHQSTSPTAGSSEPASL
jgi:hypothetical protein